MYKLLALDMDGTLLNSEKVITEEVQREIKGLINRNIEVTLATGRFPASVWLHGKQLGLTSPLVALNGAVILDAKTGKAIHTNPIPQATAVKIAEFAEQSGVYVHYYGYNILFVKEINEMNKQWALGNVVMDTTKELVIENYYDQLAYFRLQKVGKLSKFFNEKNQTIFKATMIHDDPKLIEELYLEIAAWPELSVTRTGKRRFDMNAAKVSKKTALIKICEQKNIFKEEVVAVGDFDNDAEMIEWAGLGVAMGNGNILIKETANAITKTNDENGVAEVIKMYF